MDQPTWLITDTNGSDDVCYHWKAIPSRHRNHNTEIEKRAENLKKIHFFPPWVLGVIFPPLLNVL